MTQRNVRRTIFVGCTLGAALGVGSTLGMGCDGQRKSEPTSGRASTALLSATDAGGIDAAELSAIEAWWTQNYYSDSDIQYSFETAQGEQVDCIEFNAVHSVKARLAQGKPIPTPPTSPPVPPLGIPGANFPPHVLFNGEPDQNGNSDNAQPQRSQ